MKYEDAFGPANEIGSIGKLYLPTGTIDACDPFFCADAIPFSRVVTPGSYEVQLCIVRSPSWGIRVALARALFKPGAEVVKYEEAAIAPNRPGSYIVNSGLASFMDESSRDIFAKSLEDFYASNPEGNYYSDVLAGDLREQSAAFVNSPTAGQWAMHTPSGSKINVAIFASGIGDGSYETVWGLDKEEQVVFLVTDFRIL